MPTLYKADYQTGEVSAVEAKNPLGTSSWVFLEAGSKLAATCSKHAFFPTEDAAIVALRKHLQQEVGEYDFRLGRARDALREFDRRYGGKMLDMPSDAAVMNAARAWQSGTPDPLAPAA